MKVRITDRVRIVDGGRAPRPLKSIWDIYWIGAVLSERIASDEKGKRNA